jgi:nucleolar protein 12
MIQSVRIRSIPIKESKLPKKVAFMKREINETKETVNAYVVYEKKDGSVDRAIENLNGIIFEGKHLRVDYANIKKETFNIKKSIFVGNLPLNIEDEALWEHLSSCGTIESVRIIRDSKTQQGKGFGYIQFQQRASVELALQLNGIILFDPKKLRSLLKKKLKSKVPTRSSHVSKMRNKSTRKFPKKE